MEFTNLLNTSLDLNSRPLRILDETLLPKQEADQTSNFIEKGGNASVQEERGALIEELNRVSAENKKLTEVLTVVCENYSELRNKLKEYTSKNPGVDGTTVSRKRKSESSNNNANNIGGTYNLANGPSVSCSSDEYSPKKPGEEHIKAKISRVQVRTQASDTSLVVRDGYLWRKYGQKVTRDNPSPRAYFKCSFAPSCPVKKKVQRSVEDQSIVVATYEGEHNHPHPSKLEANSRSNRSSTLGNAPCPTSLSSSGPTSSVDLTKTKPISREEARSSGGKAEAPQFQQYLVEQMASSLTKDPAFKAALAAAISGQFLQSNQP